jgi:hypothetical protein
MTLSKFGIEKKTYNYSISRDANIILNSSINYLD